MNIKKQEAQILTKLSKSCKHHNSYYWRGGGNRTNSIVCVSISGQISKLLDQRLELSPKIFEKFFSFIFKKIGWRSCIESSPSLANTILKILKVYMPSDAKLLNIYKYVSHTHNSQELLKLLLVDSKKPLKLSKPLYDYFFKKYFIFCSEKCLDNDIHTNIFSLIKNSRGYNDYLLQLMFSSRCETIMQICISVVQNNLKILDQTFLYSSCKILPSSQPVVDMFIKNGFEVDARCLEIVCEFCDIDSLKYILMYKIPIEKIHFRKLLKSKTINIDRYNRYGLRRRYRRMGVSKFPSYRTGGYSVEKVELLFKLGYKMDKDDLIFSIVNKIKIPNIDRFQIEVDHEIVNLCHKYKFYPDMNLDIIEDKHLSELQKLCRSSTFKKIKEYIDTNDVKPDQKCLENACKTGNYALVNYLILCDCSMDIEFLKDLKMDGTYERHLRWLKYRRRRTRRYGRVGKTRKGVNGIDTSLETYNGVNLHSKENIINNIIYSEKVKQKSLENRVNHLENLLKQFFSEGMNIYQDFVDDVSDIKKEYFDKDIKIDECVEFNLDKTVKDLDIEEKDCSEIKDDNTIKSINDRLGKIVDVHDSILIINENHLSRIDGLPLTKNKRSKPTKKIINFFDYNPKQMKSFNQVKNGLKQYLSMNDLYRKDKTISLDQEILETVLLDYLPKDYLNNDIRIKREDLDKLTCLFYN